ncbi:MAG: acetyl xylan esterase [Thalassobius sp.]|nr:acetyl xylan esterase [Thalassovita sp.]
MTIVSFWCQIKVNKHQFFKSQFLFLIPMFVLMMAACKKRVELPEYAFIAPSDSLINYSGRFYFSEDSLSAKFAWTGSTIKATFRGTSCKLMLQDHVFIKDGYGDPQANYFYVFIDEQFPTLLRAEPDSILYTVAQNLPDTTHTIEIFRRTEGATGSTEFLGFRLDTGKNLVEPPSYPLRKIEFIGNSITCGYGNEGDSARCKYTSLTQNGYMTYSSITARNLNAEYRAVAYSGMGIYRNYSDAIRYTMTEMYDMVYPQNDSICWDFTQWQPDVVVINLGTNDFARGNPERKYFVESYFNLLEKIRTYYPAASIFCLESPMISDYYPARRRARTTSTNYILEAIRLMKEKGEQNIEFYALKEQTSRVLGCDFHPNVEQHKQNAEELTAFIREKMGWDLVL